MNRNDTPNTDTGAETEEEGGLSFDAVLVILRRWWYLILLTALLGGGFAFWLAGNQNYVYKKTASVMMREAKSSKDPSSERIMSELGIDSGAANLANESFIMKSTALMSRVVEDLKLNTAYWKTVDFRSVELYKDSPILVIFHKIDAQRACNFTVTPRSEKEFTLSYQNTRDTEVTVDGFFDKEITLPFATLTIIPTSSMNDKWKGVAVQVRHQPVISCARALLAGLTIVRPDSKESSLLEMTLTASNPQKAADTLNQLISVYNQISKDERSQAALKTKQFIQERLAELGSELKRVDQNISDYKSKNTSVKNPENALRNDSGTIQALDKEIFNLETQLKLADDLASRLRDDSHSADLIPVDNGVTDTGISHQIEIYNEAYLEHKKISGSAGAKNPIALNLTEKMASMRTSVNKSLTNYRNNLNLQLRELKNKKADLNKQLAELSVQEKQLEQEITPLLREHKVKEELYLTLLSKEQENALALAVAQSSARVLESAHGSDAPIAPNTRQFVLIGMIGGAVLCIGIFLAAQMLDNKIKNKHDVEGVVRHPVLAELPVLSRKERKQTKMLIQDDHSIMAERLHILRNNVSSLLPIPEQGGHLILVTSTVPGEGKTFTAANLAASFAKANRKVLLIDADLRKYSLTRHLNLKGRKGLTSLLLNQVDDVNAVTRHVDLNGQNMDVIGAGPQVPNPVTLLSQPLLKSLFDFLKKQYDAVIIDAPPFGILADTSILTDLCDITLYVIRSGMIDKRYMAQIHQQADSGKLPNLAFVLNGVNFKSAGYYYYGYSYSYGYRQYGRLPQAHTERTDAQK